jgi:predicted nuclease of restriction endonuclease-like (RecB) superfamily
MPVTDYHEFVKELKARILTARIDAARTVNREMILLYWDIGRGIVEKQKKLGWGQSVIEQLAKDLQVAFPSVRGFSARNLWDMRRLYEAYTLPEFLRQAVAELPDNQFHDPLALEAYQKSILDMLSRVPWGHHLTILNKLSDPTERLYYLQAAAQWGWSRNVLLNQIKADAYHRAQIEKKANNFALVLPEHLAEQAEEVMKSAYNLEFLGIAQPIHERELESHLIERLQDFMLELGYGFCFIGQQYRLKVGDKDYFIDLLFYHRYLRALVAIELKVGEFKPEFAGKMDFYLNVLNQ